MDEVTKYHIEGGIGIGKSRLLEVLESKFGMKVFPEPLDEWRNFQISDDKKINLLQRFYERLYRYVYTYVGRLNLFLFSEIT